MRAASTRRPASASVSGWSAPPTRPTTSGTISHSACQPPRPRSSSWTIAASAEATRPGTRVAAARAAADATGLRLWGRLDEPPRPSASGSKSSATSVCEWSDTSRAILPSVPAHSPSVVTTSTTRSRCACHGSSGSGSFSSRATPAATSSPLSPSAASVPTGPPSCRTRARPRIPAIRARSRCDGVEPARGLQAERRGRGVLQPGAARDRRRAVLAREPRERVGQAHELGVDPVERLAQLQHEPGVDRVLAGGAPVHVAGGRRVFLLQQHRELPDERDREVAGESGGAREGVGVEAVRAAARGDGRGRRFRDHARPRLGARERFLEVEHRLEARAVGEDRLDRVPAEERCQQSKKTVSPVPCSTTFHSSEPSPRAAATSVARRSRGTRPSTWSEPLRGSPGK